MWHDALVDEHELGELIDELRTTVAGSGSLSDEDRRRLDGLIERVEAVAEEEDEGLLDQLDDALSRFEAEHVGLVSVINRIANVLSAGGI